ncbi:MAG: sulfatase-like hydrolase/transferase [Verrucomicrobia bacterium]|nr:sulfatase-like hydrolase/transferase [Verrucomicrobiota bacterium]
MKDQGLQTPSQSGLPLRLFAFATAAIQLALCLATSAAPAPKPNVIVILADDLGWHDLGVQGATDIKTPNIDSLARGGIRFTSGYVTSPLCSPSRAGLITGRCQQRFGYEMNPGPLLERDPQFGLPLTETTMGDRMRSLRYDTGWIGKSHLGGVTNLYHPLKRGFDEFFGFIEGHHEYFKPGIPTTQRDPILRGFTPEPEANYLTSAFAREMVDYIDRHAAEPFFLYAPFNAVHFPLEAPPALLGRFDPAQFADLTRYTNAVMLAALDDAVGAILTKLRALNLETNTLIFFASDNGAPGPNGVDKNGSRNTPLRGYKGDLYEGGIRVPVLMQWKGHLPADTVVDTPVSTLDILPTAVAAAGGSAPAAWQLDGVNLLPFLLGQTTTPTFLGLPAANAPAVRSLALNGGGRMVALTMGTPTGSTQGAALFSIYNVSDPANLNVFQFSLPTLWRARDVATLNGFGLVADDLAGLTVLNFAGADLNRQAPAITFDPAVLDLDPATAGIQVREGSTLEIAPRVQDDVQLDRVELLVDGELVGTQRVYPVTFKYTLPGLAAAANAGATVAPQGVGIGVAMALQFRAVDRSGNAALGNPLTLELVRDPQPPTLVTSLPAQNGAAFVGEPFVFEFSEAVDSTPVEASKVHLLNLGADAAPGGGDDSEVALTSSSIHGASVNLSFPAQLAAGKYQLTLQAGAVNDRVGNALAQDSVFTFILVNAHPGSGVWISDADGQFDDPTKWLHGRVPTQDHDAILQRFGARPLVTLGSSAIVKNITIGTPFTAVDRGSLYVLGNATASERVEVPAGTLIFNGSALFEKPLAITGGRVEAAGRLEARDQVILSQGGSLTMDGSTAQFVLGGAVEAVNCTFSARNGAVIELPNFVTFDSPGDFTPLFPVGAAFSSQGVGSRLTLPNLTSANGPVDWNVRGAPALRFEAVSGGELSLPKLTTLTGRTILSADGFGSILDAPFLDRITGPDSDFESAIDVGSSCRLQVPLLTALDDCNVTLDSDGLLTGGSLEIAETSSLKGAGTVVANVLNRGAILLDRVPGNLVIDGKLELGPSSLIDTTIGLGFNRDEAGRLETRGDAILDGTLKMTLGRGYSPAAGQQFEMAVFAKPPTGAISQLNDTALGASLKAELESLPDKWNLKILPRP